jgi:hypothetical protein
VGLTEVTLIESRDDSSPLRQAAFRVLENIALRPVMERHVVADAAVLVVLAVMFARGPMEARL